MTAEIEFFDAHIHLWDLEHNPYPWLQDAKPDEGARSDYDDVAKSYLYEHYREDSTGYTVVGATHVQADWDHADPVGETRWLQELADSGRTSGLPQAIVGWADLSGEPADIERVLEEHTRYPNVRGIRQMLNWDADPALRYADADFLADERWREHVALLARHGLSFDVMCFWTQMDVIGEIAARNPETVFILEHTGMPHVLTPDGQESWRARMRNLAGLGNVVTKISGLGNTIPDWTTATIRPYVLDAIELFGVERCMFASNFPTDRMFSSYRAIVDAFDEITSGASDEERERLFRGSAEHWYRVTA